MEIREKRAERRERKSREQRRREQRAGEQSRDAFRRVHLSDPGCRRAENHQRWPVTSRMKVTARVRRLRPPPPIPAARAAGTADAGWSPARLVEKTVENTFFMV